MRSHAIWSIHHGIRTIFSDFYHFLCSALTIGNLSLIIFSPTGPRYPSHVVVWDNFICLTLSLMRYLPLWIFLYDLDASVTVSTTSCSTCFTLSDMVLLTSETGINSYFVPIFFLFKWWWFDVFMHTFAVAYSYYTRVCRRENKSILTYVLQIGKSHPLGKILAKNSASLVLCTYSILPLGWHFPFRNTQCMDSLYLHCCMQS